MAIPAIGPGNPENVFVPVDKEEVYGLKNK